MQIIRKAVFTAIIGFVFSFTAGAELSVTDIENNKNGMSVTFNASLKISGISLSDGKIIFPVYANKGKVYRQFSVIKRDAALSLYNSLKSNIVSKNSSAISFKINKFKINNKESSIKAFASVIFEDVLETECRVMDGRYGLWVAWPSSKNGKNIQKQLEFIDKTLKIN
ncbi:MAG: SpoVG family protein, partial [Endomicrobium sp.]|nr:SpoVG family protein [Endomicrobium sp.]